MESGTRTTESAVLLNSTADRDLLRKHAESAANAGGSFSIANKWRGDNWYAVYVINWPHNINTKETSNVAIKRLP
jgi:hypothetical protein